MEKIVGGRGVFLWVHMRIALGVKGARDGDNYVDSGMPCSKKDFGCLDVSLGTAGRMYLL